MKHLMLGLLAAGPAHGYELRRRYDELFADAGGEVNIGQIYVTLGRLERDGLVTHTAESGADRRDRKVYRLTAPGTAALRQWLADPAEPPLVRPDVLLRLVAARLAAPLLPDVDPRTVVTEHRQRCLEALRELDRQAARTAAGSVSGLLLQATALHLQAELRWLDACQQQLAQIELKTTWTGDGDG
ncbi:PadR family transcriptional regulator [Micromonospora sp. WMMD1102]|uniref:PadR family transcriptional regulator n=1 Tax=Micromonospora sp. WMMD1102 TaxID=3016105 RepID=UPI00241501BE|nr:PadR family transcriptional regulator [Micromonospora sp. WMMD1102]MDG4786734.1 PadR family transcriptional regulator [Micromonospora sp. WMMD1102]